MSDGICTNCNGAFTGGCWICNPKPPIPLPEFDPWEQLRFARDRIRELELENKELKQSLIPIDPTPEMLEAGMNTFHYGKKQMMSEWVCQMYHSMLAAAPRQDDKGGEE